jgi:ZIP family zinc transporter
LVIDSLAGLSPVVQALIATCFTWGLTALGAALVFGTKKVNRKLLDAMLGFAAGVMIAASFWSLLAPSIELSAEGPLPEWVPPLIGFLAGGIFLRLAAQRAAGLGDHTAQHPRRARGWGRLRGCGFRDPRGFAGRSDRAGHRHRAAELPRRHSGRHAPEARGNVAVEELLLRPALAVVEPVAGVLGAAAVVLAKPILPYALAFAAGAMIFVVAEELFPEAKRGSPDIAAMSVMVGFAVMMTLDVALG